MPIKESRKNHIPSSPNGAELKARRTAFLGQAVTLVEPVLATLGLELVLASCPLENGYVVLRFCIDRVADTRQSNDQVANDQVADDQVANDQRGVGRLTSEVTLDDCAEAARAISEILGDDQNSLSSSYLLEVSSPGLDRPLVKEADYQRFQGRLVKLKVRLDGGGCSTYRGRLTQDPASGSLALDTTTGLVPFVFNQVTSCRLSLDDIAF